MRLIRSRVNLYIAHRRGRRVIQLLPPAALTLGRYAPAADAAPVANSSALSRSGVAAPIGAPPAPGVAVAAPDVAADGVGVVVTVADGVAVVAPDVAAGGVAVTAGGVLALPVGLVGGVVVGVENGFDA